MTPKPNPNPHNYMFHVELDSGEMVVWSRLTLTAAKQMYSSTAKSMPNNVERFGWEEMKKPLPPLPI
jgi:hypothetical protein